MDPLFSSEQMLLIGSSGRNAGKTSLATALISRWQGRFPVVALKITTADREGGCHRGAEGCGVCTSLRADYVLDEETDRSSDKDTAKLLAAGAEQVFWLRSRSFALKAGYAAFLQKLEGMENGALVICESNSLRELVRPGCFIMLRQEGAMKPSAAKVAPLADINVQSPFDPATLERFISRLRVSPHGGQAGGFSVGLI
jgi:hypothetical protein